MATKQTTKPSDKPEIRDGRLVVYMTPSDLDQLNDVAQKAGLTRSSLVAAILERMLIGGFSPLVGAKLCWQLQTRIEEKGYSPKSFYFGIRPLPPLPDEELTKRENSQLLANIKTELKLA